MRTFLVRISFCMLIVAMFQVPVFAQLVMPSMNGYSSDGNYQLNVDGVVRVENEKLREYLDEGVFGDTLAHDIIYVNENSELSISGAIPTYAQIMICWEGYEFDITEKDYTEDTAQFIKGMFYTEDWREAIPSIELVALRLSNKNSDNIKDWDIYAFKFTDEPLQVPSNDAEALTLEIDGQRVNFSDQQPVIVDNRTLVPVRGVFETLGYSVSWEQSTRTATLSNSINTVSIKVGSSTFTTNGKSYNLDVPAQIINGRTMLPFRAVLESIGYNVDWDSNSNTALISSVAKDTVQQTAFDISKYEYEWSETDSPFENDNLIRLEGNELYVYLTRMYYGTAIINPNWRTQEITFIGEYSPEERLTATVSFEEQGIALYIHDTENVPYGEDVVGSKLIFLYKKPLQ